MVPDFPAMRRKMVDGQIRTTDVTNIALLDALGVVPREKFVAARRRELAYIDEDIEVAAATSGGPARYLMEPSPFARLAQAAAVKPGDVVLDVGTATGYSAAVLSRLASSVIALECDAALAEQAAASLASVGYDNVAVVQGALDAGYPAEAPYDVIFVGGAVETIPDALFAQLRTGGRLVAVEGFGNAGVARLYVKDENGIVAGRRLFNAAVRPLPGFARDKVFEF